MTGGQEQAPGSGRATRPAWAVIARSVLRATASVVVFVTLYYLLPLDTSITWTTITILVSGLVILAALVAYSVRAIPSSPHPALRAVESLAVIVPLFLVLFAGSYVVMAHATSGSFTQPLSHTDGLYFAVTVFSTVGFGDITPRTEAARILVTIQMIADVAVIAIAIQAIVSAVRQGRKRQSTDQLVSRAEYPFEWVWQPVQIHRRCEHACVP